MKPLFGFLMKRRHGKLLIEDKLWKLVEPLLPAPKLRRSRYPGRMFLDNRRALTGILFVLETDIAWNDLSQEMGCGSGVACWARLRDWHLAGVQKRLHAVLLTKLRYADKIDWSRAAVDATTIRALRGGDKTGKMPTGRGRRGAKDHLLSDGNGVPFAMHATAADRHESTQLLSLLDEVPPVAGKPGRPRHKPEAVLGDRAFDSQPLREALWARGIIPFLAKRGGEHGSGLGIYRWVVESTFAWLKGFRLLRLRYKRTGCMREAAFSLAACLVCFGH